MNKKRIIYIGNFLFPNGNAAASRVLNNAKILRDIGYDVMFISPSSNEVFEEKTIVDGFIVYNYKKPKTVIQLLYDFFSIKYVIKLINKIKIKEIHSLILYNYSSFNSFKLLNFSKKNNFLLFFDLTEWYRYNIGKNAGGNFIYVLFKNIDSEIRMRYLSLKSDGVIVISKYLENYYSNKINTINLPPLVDLNDSKWSSSDNEINKKIVLTTIGRPNFNKESIIDFIKILSDFSETHDFYLNIIGVEEKRLIFLDNTIKAHLLKLGSKLNIHGRTSHEDCIKILSRSDFFVFIRNKSIVTKAGFSTKFVESISAGCPVITNDTGDLNLYLRNGYNGYLLDVTNLIVLKNQIKKILEIKKNEITKMKVNTKNSKIFHYTNYTDAMSNFLKKY